MKNTFQSSGFQVSLIPSERIEVWRISSETSVSSGYPRTISMPQGRFPESSPPSSLQRGWVSLKKKENSAFLSKIQNILSNP